MGQCLGVGGGGVSISEGQRGMHGVHRSHPLLLRAVKIRDQKLTFIVMD